MLDLKKPAFRGRRHARRGDCATPRARLSASSINI